MVESGQPGVCALTHRHRLRWQRDHRPNLRHIASQQALGIPERVACASACSLNEINHLTQQLQQLRQSLSDAA